MQTTFYYLGVSLLFTHELDAVMHSEWQLLFGLRSLPDSTAYSLFVALHLPLFFAILLLSQYPRDAVREGARLAVAAFLVVHAALHLHLASSPVYTFQGGFSSFLILSAGAFGAAYLLARWRSS